MGDEEVGMSRILFALLGPPVAWSGHFLLIYFLVALGCTTQAGWVGSGVLLATVPFLAISAWGGWIAYRSWKAVAEERSVYSALLGAYGWLPFLMLVGMGGAALFTAAIAFEAVPALMVRPCPPISP